MNLSCWPLSRTALDLDLGLSIGREVPSLPGVLLTGLVGFLVSVAVRGLGTARSGAYFSTAPFIGSVVAVIALGELATAQLLVAGAWMTLGVCQNGTSTNHVYEALLHAHSMSTNTPQ